MQEFCTGVSCPCKTSKAKRTLFRFFQAVGVFGNHFVQKLRRFWGPAVGASVGNLLRWWEPKSHLIQDCGVSVVRVRSGF